MCDKVKIHITIGLYLNGSYKMNGVLPEHLKEHIEYNLYARPGRTFIVDNVCYNKGYNSQETIDEFIEKVKNDKTGKFVITKCTAPYV